jgi:hypothetical protein
MEAKFSGTPPGRQRTVSGGQLPSPGGKNRLITNADATLSDRLRLSELRRYCLLRLFNENGIEFRKRSAQL